MLGKVVVLFMATLWMTDGASAMYSTKAMEGYPVGYLSDCPGSHNQPVITKKTLKHLGVVVHGPGSMTSAKKRKYNYYQMRELSKDSFIDWKRKTMLYVGGFLDSPSFPVAGTIATAYKRLGYNVLLLDTNYFTTMQYPLASIYTRTVGKRTAEMLVNLTRTGLDPKKLEVVGLSLGGQTISFIAKHYRQLTGANMTRLIGLDPAGPCFRNLGPEGRLDQSDADFVQIISTNIDGFGMAAPIGHVNFYVNGGEFQPGDFIWMPCNTLCSHVRSFTLWVAALQHQDSFIGLQCDSVQDARERNCYNRSPRVTNVMGPKTDKSKEGIFFLATDNNFPYALGEKGLRKENEFFSALMNNLVSHDRMRMR